MGWTKRDIVKEAYAELALAGYDFDLTPEEMETGLRRLDLLMATWTGQSIQIGYAFGPGIAASDLDQDSGIPLTATAAAVLNLAINLASGKGKALSTATKATAKAAYDAMLIGQSHDQVRVVQAQTSTPIGAGNRWGYGRRYLTAPTAAPVDGLPELP